MKIKTNNIWLSLSQKIFIIVLLSMIIKPLYVFSIPLSNYFSLIELSDFNDIQDKDLNQEDDTNEDDTNGDEEDLKMIAQIFGYSFSISKKIFLTQLVTFNSLVKDTLPQPPDLS